MLIRFGLQTASVAFRTSPGAIVSNQIDGKPVGLAQISGIPSPYHPIRSVRLEMFVPRKCTFRDGCPELVKHARRGGHIRVSTRLSPQAGAATVLAKQTGLEALATCAWQLTACPKPGTRPQPTGGATPRPERMGSVQGVWRRRGGQTEERVVSALMEIERG